MKPSEKSKIFASCSPGLAPYLVRELSAAGYPPFDVHETGVEFETTLGEAMKLVLTLRMAYHLMFLIDEFKCKSPEELYERAAAIEWENIVPEEGYFSVTSLVDHPTVDNAMFPNLKLKDAVVDRMREKTGTRPSSGKRRDKLVLYLYWKNEFARIFVNLNGFKLSDRGYRKMPYKAPLRENLAAGIVTATGYDGSAAFVNPMCGSGTLAIEAALVGLSRAPGLLRANYSLMHMKGYDEALWQKLRTELKLAPKKPLKAPIIATDYSENAIRAAYQNARTAGVEHVVKFKQCDFADTPVPEGGGIIVLNPEYGERVGEIEKLGDTYARIGDWFKSKCAGYTGYLFTGNKELAKNVGLRTSAKIPFWNARIECRLLKYEVYSGTRKRGND